jgi:hypothetical protein
MCQFGPSKQKKGVPCALEKRSKQLIINGYIALCAQALVAPLTKLAGKS